MSKHFRPFVLTVAAALMLQAANRSAAQHVVATLEIDASKPTVVRVSGRYVPDRKRPAPAYLSFVEQYAGVSGLGERVSDVSMTDQKGDVLQYRAFQAGEYVTEGPVAGFSYMIDLAPLKNPAAAGHVSWLTARGGTLFMNDLLPECSSALITLHGLRGSTAANPDNVNDNVFSFLSRRTGVLVVSTKRGPLPAAEWAGKKFFVASAHSSPAAERQILDFAAEIHKGYSEAFGPSSSAGSILINLQAYPVPVDRGNYEADTRGFTITIISSGMLFESQSAQRLHEQLRHEMFHLWLPEDVDLTGDYDWFYEGFALYRSLKLGVALNRIRFEDYLDTLSRAYDVDRRIAGKISLIDASRNRWNGDNNTVVYARGMLVAFLCDLALLDRSKGKRSIDDVIRDVYRQHSGNGGAADGNEAVIERLKADRELVPVIDDYVTGSKTVMWDGMINAAGLQAQTKSGVTTLSVAAKPGGNQKRLLDKLGYNNWRKLVSK
jgi:hypothetical protein